MRSRALVAAALLATVALPARAIELVEQGPAGVGTAGAQTADADGAAAVYYNPAALAFQPGLTAQAGAVVALRQGTASAAGGPTFSESPVLTTPTVFVGQRVSDRYAVGIGVFEPDAWSSSWPDFKQRAQGSSLELHAYDVAPSIAIRPWRWLAIGLGIDIVPTTFRWSVGSGMAPGFFVDTHATGIGGNASFLVRILPRWLDAAFAYRSAIAVALPSNGGDGTLPLPHTFTWGAASHPLAGLTVDVDVRLVLWRDLTSLTFKSPDGMTSSTLTLDWQDTVGVRAGATWRFFHDRLLARVGGGWEQSPSSPAATPSVLAIGDRGLVGGGIGASWRWLTCEASYLATIGAALNGVTDNVVYSYRAVTHTVSAAVTFRLPTWPMTPSL